MHWLNLARPSSPAPCRVCVCSNTSEATEGNKNKYVAILTVLLIGSAVIPMVQYYWYVASLSLTCVLIYRL